MHNVSQLTGVSDHKIQRVLDVYVNAAKLDEDLSDVAMLGMNETSVAKGHDYITLFVDIEKRKTLHISDGKDSKTVENFVKVLENGKGVRNQITNASCDISPAFIKGIGKYLPGVQITFDKFNILKIINEAVDNVRRAEAKDNPLLSGTRYIF